MTYLSCPSGLNNGAALYDSSQLVSITSFGLQYDNPIVFVYILGFTGGQTYTSTATFATDADAVQAAITLLGLDTSGEITLT